MYLRNTLTTSLLGFTIAPAKVVWNYTVDGESQRRGLGGLAHLDYETPDMTMAQFDKRGPRRGEYGPQQILIG